MLLPQECMVLHPHPHMMLCLHPHATMMVCHFQSTHCHPGPAVIQISVLMIAQWMSSCGEQVREEIVTEIIIAIGSDDKTGLLHLFLDFIV